MSGEVCPICASQNQLTPITYGLAARQADGQMFAVKLAALQCSFCGEKIETPELVQKNNVKLAEEKLRLQANAQQKG